MWTVSRPSLAALAAGGPLARQCQTAGCSLSARPSWRQTSRQWYGTTWSFPLRRQPCSGPSLRYIAASNAFSSLAALHQQHQGPQLDKQATPGGREDSANPVTPPVVKSEKLLNLPNLLTASRILSVPFLGHLILTEQLPAALALLFVAGCTDLLDGYLARKWNAYTVFGSIADPAADKLLMTVMVATLGWKGLMPGSLASLILLRDVALVLLAFRVRYKTLPAPFTWSRYWNPRLPSAQVEPTQISKYNTFLQLISVGGALLLPALQQMGYGAFATAYLHTPLQAVWWVTAATTVYSGWGYFVQGAGYKDVNVVRGASGRVADRLKEASRKAREALQSQQQQRKSSPGDKKE
ncbi:unnamed protein product [Parajaminaea phylloscopi]